MTGDSTAVRPTAATRQTGVAALAAMMERTGRPHAAFEAGCAVGNDAAQALSARRGYHPAT